MAIETAISQGSKIVYIGPVIQGKTPDYGEEGVIDSFEYLPTGTKIKMQLSNGAKFVDVFENFKTPDDYASSQMKKYFLVGGMLVAVSAVVWLTIRRK